MISESDFIAWLFEYKSACINLFALVVCIAWMYRMSTEAAATAAPENETEEVNLLKRNSDDIGWQFGVLVDPGNKDKVKWIS